MKMNTDYLRAMLRMDHANRGEVYVRKDGRILQRDPCHVSIITMDTGLQFDHDWVLDVKRSRSFLNHFKHTEIELELEEDSLTMRSEDMSECQYDFLFPEWQVEYSVPNLSELQVRHYVTPRRMCSWLGSSRDGVEKVRIEHADTCLYIKMMDYADDRVYRSTLVPFTRIDPDAEEFFKETSFGVDFMRNLFRAFRKVDICLGYNSVLRCDFKSHFPMKVSMDTPMGEMVGMIAPMVAEY